MENFKMNITDKDLQKIIGAVLKYGVLTVLTIGIFGGLIYLFGHQQDMVHYSVFKENDQNFFQVVKSIFVGVSHFDGRSIIYLAVLILFCTPFLRLLLSLFSFILEKDKLYILITCIVLAIIVMSVTLGFSH